jgi:hypothetical protein
VYEYAEKTESAPDKGISREYIVALDFAILSEF